MIFALIAQTHADDSQEYFRQLRYGFRHGNLMSLESLMIALSIVAGVIAILWLIERQRRGGFRTASVVIFYRIATDLGLSLSQQWALIRIARFERLSSPITLLLSPATFDHHTQHAATLMGRRSGEARRARIVAIRKLLFER